MKRILLIAVAFAMLFTLSACKDDAPAGMKLASNPIVVPYNLYVPEEWEAVDTDTTNPRALDNTNTATAISVAEYENATADEWWGVWRSAYTENGFEIVEEGTPTIVDGKSAKTYVYKKNDTTINLVRVCYSTAVEHNGKVYIILLTSVEGEFYENALEITKEDILPNFRFN